MAGTATDAGRIERVPIRLILPNPLQPRQVFDEDELNALALSIAEHGILQMPVVRPGALTADGEKGYYLIAGERRTRAADRAGFYEIDVVVRDVEPFQAGVLAAIENLQRADLSPFEEADMILSLQAAAEKAGEELTAPALARKLGKGRGVGWIANRLDLQGFGLDAQQLVRERPDALVHARTIDSISQPGMRALLIAFAAEGGAYNPLREFARYVQEAGRHADLKVLQSLVEFYTERETFLRRNLIPLEERVTSEIQRARPATTSDAPDSQTSSRRKRNSRTGGGNMSRGQEVTGTSARESKRELRDHLTSAKHALLSAVSWRQQIPGENIERELTELRALLDQIEGARSDA